jgi:6-phosphogluconate dehydrogenase (decarboxylating)
MTDGAARVGFIGLGHMGYGMAVNILKHGFPSRVIAHRNRKAVDDLVHRGALEVSTPKLWRPLAMSSFFASLAQRKLRLCDRR